MYPHRIRLRGPWECEPLARAGEQAGQPLPPPCQMTMPCRWREGGLGDFAGRVRFRRHFGYPGQIDSYERVWLTFAGADTTADVWLNGQYLGRYPPSPSLTKGGTTESQSFEFEVTALLERRNELVVEVEALHGEGGLWGEVALEVRCTAFLRGMRIWVEGEGENSRLHAVGEVAGTCERPLDLYVLLDGSTIIYATVEAAPGGQPFHLCSDALACADPARSRLVDGTYCPAPDQPHRVRVELVSGAVVWYALEQEMLLRGQ